MRTNNILWFNLIHSLSGRAAGPCHTEYSFFLFHSILLFCSTFLAVRYCSWWWWCCCCFGKKANWFPCQVQSLLGLMRTSPGRMKKVEGTEWEPTILWFAFSQSRHDKTRLANWIPPNKTNELAEAEAAHKNFSGSTRTFNSIHFCDLCQRQSLGRIVWRNYWILQFSSLNHFAWVELKLSVKQLFGGKQSQFKPELMNHLSTQQ